MVVRKFRVIGDGCGWLGMLGGGCDNILGGWG